MQHLFRLLKVRLTLRHWHKDFLCRKCGGHKMTEKPRPIFYENATYYLHAIGKTEIWTQYCNKSNDLIVYLDDCYANYDTDNQIANYANYDTRSAHVSVIFSTENWTSFQGRQWQHTVNNYISEAGYPPTKEMGANLSFGKRVHLELQRAPQNITRLLHCTNTETGSKYTPTEAIINFVYEDSIYGKDGILDIAGETVKTRIWCQSPQEWLQCQIRRCRYRRR